MKRLIPLLIVLGFAAPAQAQSGPPSPRPDLWAAVARGRESADASCRKINAPVAITLKAGIPPVFAQVGECPHSKIVVDWRECSWQWSRTPHGRQPGKWICQIHLKWRTTGFTAFALGQDFAPPCLQTVANQGFIRSTDRVWVSASRTVHVFLKRDGTVGRRVFPWGSCAPSRFG